MNGHERGEILVRAFCVIGGKTSYPDTTIFLTASTYATCSS